MPITLKLSASGPWVTALALLVLSAGHGIAQKNYGPGVTDGEVKLGQTMPYSGPASALSAAGKAEAAYFAMVNAAGGVNRCRIKLISLDDSYTPPKTVEQTRKLIEQEKVLALFSPLGTAANSAIHKYVNARCCRASRSTPARKTIFPSSRPSSRASTANAGCASALSWAAPNGSEALQGSQRSSSAS